MVAVNPTPTPVQDPNYLYWSRAIQQPEGNKSVGTALTAAGDIIGDVAKAAETDDKQLIDTSIHQAVDSEQNKYIASLQAADPLLQHNQTNILGPQVAQATPPQLQGLPKTVDTLGAARANGKLSETDYIGRMDMIAKDFRARFPGHRDYVDEVFRRASGLENTANGYIRSMLADINATQSTKQSAEQKLLTEMTSGGNIFPDTPQAIQKYRNGGFGQPGSQEALDGLTNWFAQRKGMGNAYTLQDNQFKYIKSAREYQQQGGEDEAVGRLTNEAARHLDNLVNNNGVKITDLVGNPESGPGYKTTDEQFTQYGNILQGDRLNTLSDINKYLDEKNEAGMSRRMLLGSAKSQDMINKALYFHDQAIEAIFNKDHGLAFRNLHMGVAGLQDFTRNTYLADPDRRLVGGLMFATKEIGGVNAINQAVLGTNLLSSDTTGRLQQSFDLDKMKLMSQTTGEWIPGRMKVRQSPEPITVDSVMDHAAEGKNVKDPNYFSGLVSFGPKLMQDPNVDPKIKANLAVGYYSEGNQKAIMKFNEDTVENGRQVRGYNHVFNEWYSPKQSEAMAELEKVKPGTYDMYRTSAETSFQNISLQDFPQLQTLKDYGFKFDWDPSTNTLRSSIDENKRTEIMKNSHGAALSDPKLNYTNQRLAANVANRITTNINNLLSVEETNPNGQFDKEGFVENMFKQKGVDVFFPKPKAEKE